MTVTPAAAATPLASGYAVLDAATADRAWLAVPTSTSSASAKTYVFGTTNAGRSWRQSALAGNDPVAIDFVSPNRGWLLESLGAAMQQNPVRLYRTSDGGLRWSLIAKTARMPGEPSGRSGLPEYCDKDGLAFRTALTGWITGACNGLADAILVTSDGGAHWKTEPVPVPATMCEQAGCEVPAPQFAGGSTFLQVNAYPAAAYLLVSSDAGQPWQVSRLPGGAGPYPRSGFSRLTTGSRCRPDPRARSGGMFYLTTDGGHSWTAVRQGRHFREHVDELRLRQPAAIGLRVDYPALTPLAAACRRCTGPSDSGRTWTIVHAPAGLTAAASGSEYCEGAAGLADVDG